MALNKDFLLVPTGRLSSGEGGQPPSLEYGIDSIPMLYNTPEKEGVGVCTNSANTGVSLALSGDHLACGKGTISKRTQSRLNTIKRWAPSEVLNSVLTGTMSVNQAYQVALRLKKAALLMQNEGGKSTIGEVILRLFQRPIPMGNYSRTWTRSDWELAVHLVQNLKKTALLSTVEYAAIQSIVGKKTTDLGGLLNVEI